MDDWVQDETLPTDETLGRFAALDPQLTVGPPLPLVGTWGRRVTVQDCHVNCTTRVKVDFNSVTKDGRVRATARRADGPLAEGDPVIAYDAAEHLSHPAVVASIDPDTGRVLLAVDWEHACP